MKTILKHRAFGTFFCLLFLCSCATTPDSSSVIPGGKLPAGLRMNKDAGCTQPIFVTVQLESGEELPFVLDTGTLGVVFNRSLEPKLGKRLRTVPVSIFGAKQEADIYAAPKLYLGGALLLNTDTNVASGDLGAGLGRPVMGMLGMDVLEHYCIQLDFAAHRIRFLDDEGVSKKDWGKPFPLTEGCFFISENLVGGEASNSLSLIDTGYNGDGWLTPSLFQQWTNQAILPAAGQARSPNGWLGGESYPDLNLQRCEEPYNGIGLYVLSRHLVTLDFPKRTMYLKRTSVGPLHLDIKEVKAEAKSAAVVLKSLKNKGRLPGWTKDDKAATEKVRYIPRSTVSGCFVVQKKNGDLSVYHFQVIRASENQLWKLQKAWRTDENGRTLEEYPIP
jgi:hypothetical protein